MANTGFNGPIVHGPALDGAKFAYRTGMGMMPSAEFAVLHDDFLLPFASNTTIGWTAIIDTGGTSITNLTATVGANGVMAMNSDDASEGSAIYGAKAFQLVAGKKAFIECKVRMDDVIDNTFQFGLSSLTAVTNPEDLWTTTATDLVTFGIGDGDSNPKMLVDKSNSGTSQQVQVIKGMLPDVWATLAIYFDGTNVHGYVDGTWVMVWGSAATTIPVGVPLALFVGHLNGNGAGNNTSLVDYVRFVSER
jgi:hypothetical protein